MVFYWLYREPRDHKGVNEAELDYIAQGGGFAKSERVQDRVPFSWSNVGKLLSYRQVWGAGIGQFAGNSTLVFFLTWFPTYLATERHMTWVKVGFFAVLPFLAAAIGVLVGGWVSDKLLKTTGSANIARKGPIIFGLLLASLIVTANWMDSNTAVIAVLSIAFFGQGMVGLGWTLISDIAPKQLMGLTGGIFNFAANLAGIITPIVIGFIVSRHGIVRLCARVRRRRRSDWSFRLRFHPWRRPSPRSRRGQVGHAAALRVASPGASARRPQISDIVGENTAMITGKTKVIAHLGYPTEGFKAPMIYNPWFETKGIDAVVVPLGVKGDDYPESSAAALPRHQLAWRTGDDAQ